MRITRFEVENFKNFEKPVVLDELGPFNVLHGANNVGKSNVLKAIDLFFRLVRFERADELPIVSPRHISDYDFLALTGQSRPECFNLWKPLPIRLGATLNIPEEDLEASGIRQLLPSSTITIELELVWAQDHTELRVRRFVFANGNDITKAQPSADDKTYALRFARFLAFTLLGDSSRFARVRAQRTNKDTTAALAARLYDARESPDLARAQQWERFVTIMKEFGDVLGGGKFVPLRPKIDESMLVFQTEKARIPLHLLGTGVQQVVSVVGMALVPGADIVAIEEPEIHLRVSLQDRLRELLRALPESPGGPSQIFVTSHSPFFEFSDHFYFMHLTADGSPQCIRRPSSEASLAVEWKDPEVHHRTATSFLSREGVLRLPADVMGHMALQHGGSVVVRAARDRVAEIVPDAVFLKEKAPPAGDAEKTS